MKHADVKMDKSMMQKAVNKHESRLHKGETKTKLSAGGYTRAADGIAQKGKTKGKNLGDDGPFVGIEKGGKKTAGVTGKAMRAVGRNMARANNQK